MAGGEYTPADAEADLLLPPPAGAAEELAPPPPDTLGIAYAIFFTLGTGFLLPWNAFITAVDYFSYLYPGAPVDRVFSVSYMLAGFLALLLIVLCFSKSSAPARINTGLALFTASLLVVPVMDAAYVRGVPRLYAAFDVTVAATVVCGVADALVQGGVVGFAGELPKRYMQAVLAGTAVSGVLVSALRVITKGVYPQDSHGLRKSAILYFVVSIVVMIICIVCYNVAGKLPIVLYYKNIKKRAQKAEEDGGMSGSSWRSTLWSIVGRVKWHGIGIAFIYGITLSIFPGYITEDVHSEALKDWYPIILITAYNVFDLIGKSLPAFYFLENANVAITGSFARLLFYPLFYGCLHGPSFFRTEIPVTILTCLLGLTNGYLTCILISLAPKAVPIQHSETAGIVITLFLVTGLVSGSFVSWFWVI
ncbi:equilibrative nucleotide transporter 1-like [Oryza brachyantha]|uniref:equilibrative nucleotide transporter 1-like n=1 Tax=Oryza brachyantha TaxID=4533 RepID=UPI001AD9C62B|nr:equilibrative nucleotide transporter 1-like [Oryza brachyantha]